jgi:hypothetical protein
METLVSLCGCGLLLPAIGVVLPDFFSPILLTCKSSYLDALPVYSYYHQTASMCYVIFDSELTNGWFEFSVWAIGLLVLLLWVGSSGCNVTSKGRWIWLVLMNYVGEIL